MQTLNELLKEAGATEEVLAKLPEVLKGKGSSGKDLELIVTNNGEYVKGAKYDELNNTYSKLKEDYEVKTKEFSNFEEVRKKLAEKETEFETAKTTYASNELALKKKFEIEKRLIRDEVPEINNSYNAYLGQFDYDSIEVDENGRFTNVDNVYDAFKQQNKSFYSAVTKKVYEKQEGNDEKKAPERTLKDMTLTERIELKMKNPELYKTLK